MAKKKVLNQLTDIQIEAAKMLAYRETEESVCQVLGVSMKTVKSWEAQPNFKRVREALEILRGLSLGLITGSSALKAVEVVLAMEGVYIKKDGV